MPLTDEQAKSIKEQLLAQLSRLPAQQQEVARKFISSMNPMQLEQFLIQNKIMVKQSPQPISQKQVKKPEKTKKLTKREKEKQECVFCAIANNAMESISIYEDKEYLAVLELNPFSQGHTILIPKKHIRQTKSLPSKALSLANRIGKHIIKKLKAKTFQVTTETKTNHAVIDIIPIYRSPITERKKATAKEIRETAIKIGEIPKKKTSKKSKKQKETKVPNPIEKSIIRLPRRIP